jgi:Ca2+-binding RTX toxin-like protein
MATITLSKTLMSVDLSSLFNPNSVLITGTIQENITGFFDQTYFPTSSSTSSSKNGNTTTTYTNPTYTTDLGNYQLTGKIDLISKTGGSITSASAKITNLLLTDGSAGLYSLKGSYSGTTTYKNDGAYQSSYTFTASSFSYAGSDGTKWTLNTSINETGSYNSSTQLDKGSFKQTITGFSSTDSNGNSVTFSGSYKYSYIWDSSKGEPVRSDFAGNMTAMTLNVAGTKISVTGLKLGVSDFFSESYSYGTVSDLMPTVLAGNDVITISSSDAYTDIIYGYSGNDKITGSSGDDIIYGDVGFDDYDLYISIKGKDTLIGGNGNDLLYGGGGADDMSGGPGDDILFAFQTNDQMSGGAGSDTFSFYNSDSKAMNATVKDFKSGTDFLDIWYDSESQGMDGAPLKADNFSSGKGLKSSTNDSLYVYDTSTGKLYFDSDSSGAGKGVLIVTLVGKPTLSASDFAFENY